MLCGALGVKVRFVRRLLHVELVSQAALALCAVLFGVTFVFLETVSGQSVSPGLENLLVILSLAYVVYVSGILPVVLVGAPIYAVLEAHERATGRSAILIGAIPGAVLLFVSFTPLASRLNITPYYSLIYIACGVSVAVATHLLRTWKIGIQRAP